MFVSWLTEQDDRSDSVGNCARLILLDMNNGCLANVRSIRGILQHLLERHPKLYLEVQAAMAIAVKEYAALSENYKGL
jgi:hypothetical protein